MKNKQKYLEKLKKEYGDMGCPKPPEGLPNAEQIPVPTSPERAAQVAPNISPAKVVVGGVVAGGLGYLIFRGVRLLPSLLPPLWPTLVPNLISP